MPDHADTISTKAVIAAAEPQLFVADIKSSCDFFNGKLGFKIAFTYGEPPFYAQVMRDGVRLNLRCVEQPVIDAELRNREELLSASLTVATAEEIKALFLENVTNPRLIEQIAKDTGAIVGPPLYSDALSKPGGPAASYAAMFEHNVATLVAGMLMN